MRLSVENDVTHDSTLVSPYERWCEQHGRRPQDDWSWQLYRLTAAAV